jgi:hypothetical protein
MRQPVPQEDCAADNGWTRAGNKQSLTLARWKTQSIKTADGSSFVRIHIEDSEQLRDLQKIADLFRQMQQFQVSIPVFYGGEAADELADSRAVDVVHVCKIEQNLRALVVQQAADCFSQQSAPVSQGDTAAQVHNSNFPSVAMRGVQCHLYSFILPAAARRFGHRRHWENYLELAVSWTSQFPRRRFFRAPRQIRP